LADTRQVSIGCLHIDRHEVGQLKSAPALRTEPCGLTEPFSVAISASPHLRPAILDESARPFAPLEPTRPRSVARNIRALFAAHLVHPRGSAPRRPISLASMLILASILNVAHIQSLRNCGSRSGRRGL
jgi:hypothetical protein